MSEHVVGHIKGRKVWGSEKRGEEERRGKGGGGAAQYHFISYLTILINVG